MQDVENVEVFLARIAHEQQDLQQELAKSIGQAISQDFLHVTRAIVSAIALPDKGTQKAAMNFFLKLPDQKHAIRALLAFMVVSVSID